jgi:hypothetical protein
VWFWLLAAMSVVGVVVVLVCWYEAGEWVREMQEREREMSEELMS